MTVSLATTLQCEIGIHIGIFAFICREKNRTVAFDSDGSFFILMRLFIFIQ